MKRPSHTINGVGNKIQISGKWRCVLLKIISKKMANLRWSTVKTKPLPQRCGQVLGMGRLIFDTAEHFCWTRAPVKWKELSIWPQYVVKLKIHQLSLLWRTIEQHVLKLISQELYDPKGELEVLKKIPKKQNRDTKINSKISLVTNDQTSDGQLTWNQYINIKKGRSW